MQENQLLRFTCWYSSRRGGPFESASPRSCWTSVTKAPRRQRAGGGETERAEPLLGRAVSALLQEAADVVNHDAHQPAKEALGVDGQAEVDPRA